MIALEGLPVFSPGDKQGAHCCFPLIEPVGISERTRSRTEAICRKPDPPQFWQKCSLPVMRYHDVTEDISYVDIQVGVARGDPSPAPSEEIGRASCREREQTEQLGV